MRGKYLLAATLKAALALFPVARGCLFIIWFRPMTQKRLIGLLVGPTTSLLGVQKCSRYRLIRNVRRVRLTRPNGGNCRRNRKAFRTPRNIVAPLVRAKVLAPSTITIVAPPDPPPRGTRTAGFHVWGVYRMQAQAVGF